MPYTRLSELEAPSIFVFLLPSYQTLITVFETTFTVVFSNSIISLEHGSPGFPRNFATPSQTIIRSIRANPCSNKIHPCSNKTVFLYPFIILPTSPGPHSTNSVMPSASMCYTLCVQRTGARIIIYFISTK